MIRGWRLYPILGIGLFLWLLGMAVLPTFDTTESPLLIPGFVIILMVFIIVISTLVIYLKSPRAIAPGANFTLARAEPTKTIKVATFKNSPGLEMYNIYPLNGTPIGPINGGMKEGIAVVPVDLDIPMVNQHFWNVSFKIYRRVPNKGQGEQPLDYLPGPILLELKGLGQGIWHPDTPVWFGRLPYVAPEKIFNAIKNRDLKDELDMVNAQNKILASTNEMLRTTITEQSQTIKHVAQFRPDTEQQSGIFRRRGGDGGNQGNQGDYNQGGSN